MAVSTRGAFRPSPDWKGRRGFVHEIAREILSGKGEELTAAEFLLCGQPALIAAARSTLLALGAEAAKILVEDFGV